MTEPCPICDHPKHHAITAALLSGRHIAVVARQFRLEIEALRQHAEASHLSGHGIAVDDPDAPDEMSLMTGPEPVPTQAALSQTWPFYEKIYPSSPVVVIDNEAYVLDALALFKKSWHVANERTRQDMVQFIKDELPKMTWGYDL